MATKPKQVLLYPQAAAAALVLFNVSGPIALKNIVNLASPIFPPYIQTFL